MARFAHVQDSSYLVQDTMRSSEKVLSLDRTYGGMKVRRASLSNQHGKQHRKNGAAFENGRERTTS